MFSYKAQVDDNMEDDTVSLPHQQSFSSLKTDSDYIYQVRDKCLLFFLSSFHVINKIACSQTLATFAMNTFFSKHQWK